MIFTIIAALGVWLVIFFRKSGFYVLNAHLIKTKHAFPILSLTISFRGMPVSYINPMIYIKSKGNLYKTNFFSGKGEGRDNLGLIRETPNIIKHEKFLPHNLGVFTINVFYPTDIKPYNKTYLFVTSNKGKIKKFRLKYKIT